MEELDQPDAPTASRIDRIAAFLISGARPGPAWLRVTLGHRLATTLIEAGAQQALPESHGGQAVELIDPHTEG